MSEPTAPKPLCGRIAYLWDGEYESERCVLPEGHEGLHDDAEKVRWDNTLDEVRFYSDDPPTSR